MEAKYYTPKIEEFHKGFEFEWFQNDFKKETFAITTDDDLEIIDDEIREGKIRVKCLDREDIESLGFEINKKFGEYYKSSCNGFAIRIKDKPRNNNDISLELYEYDEYWVDKLIFKGEIRNKYELKQVLLRNGILK